MITFNNGAVDECIQFFVMNMMAEYEYVLVTDRLARTFYHIPTGQYNSMFHVGEMVTG